MAVLRVEKFGDGIALVPDEATQELLQAKAGDVLDVEQLPRGKLGISAPGRTHEERFEQGRAFLARYRKTFEDLAK